MTGSMHIYSDCLGALNKVKNLPPHRIPSKCRHLDVLKNIIVHCSDLSFTRLFSHVLAHQDDRTKFEDLIRLAQLNCVVDFGAKRALLELDALDLPHQQPFPLEAISMFAGLRDDDFGYRTLSTVSDTSPIGKRGILGSRDSLQYTV